MTREPVDVLAADPGTAGREIAPAPTVPATQTATRLLTEDVGFVRAQTRHLHDQVDDLHQRSRYLEWDTRGKQRVKAAMPALLDDLAELGFAWRDIARLVGVTVPAVQKWRRGESATGENRKRVASLLAACDLISEDYMVEDVASWFEVPIIDGVPITPLDLYTAKRWDLAFEYASGHTASEDILTTFDSDWREHYRSEFETFRTGDGQLSLRPKDQRNE